MVDSVGEANNVHFDGLPWQRDCYFGPVPFFDGPSRTITFLLCMFSGSLVSTFVGLYICRRSKNGGVPGKVSQRGQCADRMPIKVLVVRKRQT